MDLIPMPLLRRVEQYRLPAVLIAAMSCTVSMILTMKLCTDLRGGEDSRLTVAIGVVWELAKCYFAATGVAFLSCHRWKERFGGVILLALSTVLTAGSVVASLAYFVELDGADQHEDTVSVRQY